MSATRLVSVINHHIVNLQGLQLKPETVLLVAVAAAVAVTMAPRADADAS